MSEQFFPQRPASQPTIYAYEDTHPQYAGLLKVGYTTQDVQTRVAQQYPILRPGALPYRIVLEASAMRRDGTSFTDREVHRRLCQSGIHNPNGEWFACSMQELQAAILAVRERAMNNENRSLNFAMRPEQAEAVAKTEAYFNSFRTENVNKAPHFL